MRTSGVSQAAARKARFVAPLAKTVSVDKEIAAYERLRPDLEARYMGRWVLIHEEKLVGVFRSFEETAAQAVDRFGRGPYAIRRVGAPPVLLPASVMHRLRRPSPHVC
jgi:hypothetical protein